MKIVHVVESLDVGGLEHTVLALARAQRRRGHGVALICLWHRGALAERAAAEGIDVQCCNKRGGLDLLALRALRGMLARARADVVHSHNSMAHYYTAAAALGLGLPRLLSTRHGMGSADLNARRERLYRLAMRRTDAAVSVCAAARTRFVEQRIMPAHKAVVVPNGIELAHFMVRDAEHGQRLRQALGLPAQALLFGSIGRLHEAKRQRLLLRALRMLLDDGQAAALVLVGEGDQRASLEEDVDELGLNRHVRMLGARADVPELLAGMDVFVLPSRTEGYSLALVEASAAALAIIATRVGGNAEIVEDGVGGLLVPAEDVNALARAMAQMLADAPLRQRLGAAARAWALREGSLETMAERYLALYHDPQAARVSA